MLWSFWAGPGLCLESLASWCGSGRTQVCRSPGTPRRLSVASRPARGSGACSVVVNSWGAGVLWAQQTLSSPWPAVVPGALPLRSRLPRPSWPGQRAGQGHCSLLDEREGSSGQESRSFVLTDPWRLLRREATPAPGQRADPGSTVLSPLPGSSPDRPPGHTNSSRGQGVCDGSGSGSVVSRGRWPRAISGEGRAAAQLGSSGSPASSLLSVCPSRLRPSGPGVREGNAPMQDSAKVPPGGPCLTACSALLSGLRSGPWAPGGHISHSR